MIRLKKNFCKNRLQKITKWHTYIKLGNIFFKVTMWTYGQIIFIAGGIGAMPWYSNIGFVITGIGAGVLILCCVAHFLETRISIMSGVDILKSKKYIIDNFRISMLGADFSRDSRHSADAVKWIILLFELAKENKISLFGSQKHLAEEMIAAHNINLDRLSFDSNDMPMIVDYNDKPLYTDLKVDKFELLSQIGRSTPKRHGS